MRAASAALLAAAMFFAGVLVGGRGVAGEPPAPAPVTLVAAQPGSPQPTPSETPLDVEEVPREIDEGSIEDYDDDDHDDDSSGPGSGDESDDNSGPGSGDDDERDDSSGPGSGDDDEPDDDSSGPGSGDEPDDDNSGPGS